MGRAMSDDEIGPLAEAVAAALEDRGNAAAAAWVRENEDEAWGQHIGPMLDAIEDQASAVTDWSWFRVDRKGAKWHRTRAIFPGVKSARVFRAECGAALGDSPEREPRAVITNTEPSAETSCKRCMKRGAYLG